MSLRTPELTNRDHINMDAFLGHVLEDFKAGVITKAKAVDGLAHVISAVDSGNYSEAAHWFEQGRKLIRSDAQTVEITPAERQRRHEAWEFAKANVALEGFTQTKEAQAHAQRFINGEIDLKGYLAPTYKDIHGR